MLKVKMISARLVFLALPLLLLSCGQVSPEPIKLNTDACHHCKMNIADLKFGAELITSKGRIYKFDDLKCMRAYAAENPDENARLFVADHNDPKNLLHVKDAYFVLGGHVLSPMNGNIAAFAQQKDAEAYASEKHATTATWEEVNK